MSFFDELKRRNVFRTAAACALAAWALLQRQGVERPPAVEIPFKCPPEG